MAGQEPVLQASAHRGLHSPNEMTEVTEFQLNYTKFKYTNLVIGKFSGYRQKRMSYKHTALIRHIIV
jgi:hypothetical protein